MLTYWKTQTIYKQYKTKVVIIEIQVKIKHLHFTIKVSFFDEINYWMWGDFLKKVTHRRRSNTENSSRAFVKEPQWSKICSTVNRLDKPSTEMSIPSKYTSVRKVYWTYLAVGVVGFVCLFVCLLLNGTSALFRPLVPRIVEIEHTNHVKNDLK